MSDQGVLPRAFSDLGATDALQQAHELYAKYVELSQIAQIPITPQDSDGVSWVGQAWDQPVGIVTRAEAQDAPLEATSR